MKWRVGDLGRFRTEDPKRPRFEAIGATKDRESIKVWYSGTSLPWNRRAGFSEIEISTTWRTDQPDPLIFEAKPMIYKICLTVEQDGAWAPFETLDREYTSAFEATTEVIQLNKSVAPGERYCVVTQPGATDIVPGVRYRHFKGGLYEVQTIAVHSETQETLVIYKALAGASWARSALMWTEEVSWPDGKQRPRFSPETEELRNLFAPSKG